MSGAATILPFEALDLDAMLRKLSHLRLRASSLPADAPADSCLAASGRPRGTLPLRATIVAASCEEAARRARTLEERLLEHPDAAMLVDRGAALARREAVSHIGVLFPGQVAPVAASLGCLGEHLPAAAAAHGRAGLSGSAPPPELRQLAVVAASLAALRGLESLGVSPAFALGHSLGELVALHWAGAFDEATLLKLARARGRAMTADGGGAMAAVRADAAGLAGLLDGEEAVVACFNAPRQHVVSGEAEAIETIVKRARDRRLLATRLDVTGAFHSPLMEAAARSFERDLEAARIGGARRPVVSSVTGTWLDHGEDVRNLLARQIGSPVLFSQAMEQAGKADLLVEVGPGRVLSQLVPELTDTPVVSLPAEADERRLCEALAALWACGSLRSAPPGLGAADLPLP